jgi:hypothetical protein
MLVAMTRKRLLVVLAALVAIVVAGTVAVPWPRPRVTSESFARVQVGMSRAEVERLVGPPGDYTTGPMGVVIFDHTSMWPADTTLVWWRGDGGIGSIAFDADSTVADVRFWPAGPAGPLERVLWQVESAWRRWFR